MRLLPAVLLEVVVAVLEFKRHGLSSSPRTVIVRVVSTVRVIIGLAMDDGFVPDPALISLRALDPVNELVDDLLTPLLERVVDDVVSFFTTFLSGEVTVVTVVFVVVTLPPAVLLGVNSAVFRPVVVTGVMGLLDWRLLVADPLTASDFSDWISCSSWRNSATDSSFIVSLIFFLGVLVKRGMLLLLDGDLETGSVLRSVTDDLPDVDVVVDEVELPYELRLIPPNPVRLLEVVVEEEDVVVLRSSAESARFLAGAAAARDGDSDGVRFILMSDEGFSTGSGSVTCDTTISSTWIREEDVLFSADGTGNSVRGLCTE